MRENAVTINISLNRDNIRFTVFKMSKTDQIEYMGWLIEMVKKQNILAPDTIIFCSTMLNVAKVFGLL